MSDIQTEAGSAGVPDRSPGEQRAADLMAGNEAELQAANEPVPSDDAEPQLSGPFRFEAGEVDDLVAFMKAWVDWRMAHRGDTKDSGATRIGGGAGIF